MKLMLFDGMNAKKKKKKIIRFNSNLILIFLVREKTNTVLVI